MGHFFKALDAKVIQVIVAEPKFFLPRDQGGDGYVDSSPGQWLQCSYNTRGGIYYDPETGLPAADQSKALRGNFPGVGFTYDAVEDKCYAPQPFPSWVLNRVTWTWDAPTPMPTDGKYYKWDEPTLAWIEIVITPPTSA